MDGRGRKMVFVTVGTTCFDALVKAVDTQQVKEELLRKGYTDLIIQMGRGSYIPSKFSGEDGSLSVDYFTFSPSIADYLKSACLVIGHADVGCTLEDDRGPLSSIASFRWMSSTYSTAWLPPQLSDR